MCHSTLLSHKISNIIAISFHDLPFVPGILAVLISEKAVLNVLLDSVIYGPCLWMAVSLGPLRERALWTSKEPRQLSSMPCSSAGLCWARRNLRADLVILPLWSHWNCVFTYCPWQESIFIMLLVTWFIYFFIICLVRDNFKIFSHVGYWIEEYNVLWNQRVLLLHITALNGSKVINPWHPSG